MAEGTVFALPPGVDFARELVQGLIARMEGQPPEAMARVQLIVNTGRMQRRVREEFDRHGARLLPRLRLVTDLGRDPLAGLPPAVPSLRRRLELAQLVARMVAHLPGFEAGSGIFSLADSLADLMAEMHNEGVTPDRFDQIEIAETHAEHWRHALAFIRIVTRFFEDETIPDADARQRRVIEALERSWPIDPPQDPVIVAGSTGSRGTTALLLRAVARLPKGMIVLPGFDFDMPENSWNSLYSGDVPIEDHPQFRFHALLQSLNLPRDQVARWTKAAPPAPERNALLSLALRPAPVTDQWLSDGPTLGDLHPACEGMTLIAAPDPRREANAIALILREAAETGTKAALITPDRMLSRRVTAALGRWGIIPDDSAGAPLHHTAPGRFLRHIATMRGRRLTLESLLILLKHPLTATGSTERGNHLRYTRELELRLRRYGPAFPDGDALRAWGLRGDIAQQQWADWLAGAIAGLEEAPKMVLSACIETHLRFATAFAAGPGGAVEASGLWGGDAGMACLRTMNELSSEATHAGDYSAGDYADLISRLLQRGMVRQTGAAHPGIAILGTLEARAHAADLMILAGLNEGSWPETPAPDPWLSRRMRLESGLLLPERQIGLSAHDFQQAMGARRVVISRARRDAEAETVPSRWLNRLTNLLGGLPAQHGPEALAAMEARGKHWLDLAEAVETPREPIPPAPRPSPRPPVAARPRELPVTAIRNLIRDPYAIYAGRILRLRPLDPMRPAPDPRLRGQVLHLIVERFIRERTDNEPPEAAEARLMQIAQSVMESEIPWPSVQRLWLGRIARIARKFLRDEAERMQRGTPAVIEKKGAVSLQKSIFTLTAKPDRIDILEDGRAQIYDYKSGKPPSDDAVLHFDKQMLLEAAMVERGGFDALGPAAVAGMTYIRLGGDGETRDIKPKETLDEVWDKFETLIARYLTPEQGYSARRALQKSTDASDYDHLSRFGEWEMSDDPTPEDLE
ncbi:double-strand break repair protein AddB [Sinirhodobacter sp. HNIBRBA609]|nr:double-strand break repair protein AddB [Sinirhodobacter sp. HNIBRBA609]